MIRSRAWDKFETALLIESYIKIEQGLVSRSLELEGLSKRLRQMAINRGETIDDTFRNFNGMNWQCALIKQVFQNTTYSDRNNSKIFIEMVQLYQTDRLAFDQILEQAHQMVAKDILNQQDENIKEEYSNWLKQQALPGKITPSACIANMEQISKIAQSHGLMKCDFWAISNRRQYNEIKNKIVSNRFLRMQNRMQFLLFDKLSPYYAKFLEEKQSARHSDSALPLAMRETPPSPILESNEKLVNFDDISNLAYAKPIAIILDNVRTRIGRWKDAYMSVLRYIYGKNPNIIIEYCERKESLIGGTRPDFCFSQDSGILRRPKLIADECVVETNHSATDLMRRLKEIIDIYNTSNIGQNSPLNLQIIYTDVEHSTESVPQIKRHVENTQLLELLENKFPYGFHINSVIDVMKLRHFANEAGVLVTPDDELLKKEILLAGVSSEGKIYFISDAKYGQIEDFLKSIFEQGPTVLYYEKLYIYNQNWFDAHNIASMELLRNILASRSNSVYASKNFIALGNKRLREVEAVERELGRVWGDNVKHSYDELYQCLPYIPEDKIRYYLSYAPGFVWSSNETFINVDQIVITDYEKENIYSYVDHKCNLLGYVSINEVPLGDIAENNYEISISAIYDIIYKLVLSKDFDLNGKILTRYNTSNIDIVTIAKTYCAGKDRCTLSELNEYIMTVNGAPNRQAAFEAAYSELIRAEADLFVSEKMVVFCVEAIDHVLEQHIKEDFAPIKSIATFIMFPDCNFPWNHYLLESFCYRYSKKFRLEVLHFNDKNVGIIVKKDFNHTYYDILTMAVAESGIELDRAFVGQYLYDVGYTTRRSMAALEGVIDKARLIREAK